MSKDPITGLVALFGAMGDLATLFGALAEVAPPEIKSDVEEVRAAFQKGANNQADLATDPLALLGANAITALSSAGAAGRVDQYTSVTCGFPAPQASSGKNSAPATPAPYSIEPFLFRTPDGWTYKMTPHFQGLPALHASKEVTRVPPGFALLTLSVSLPAYSFSVQGNTPGRIAPEQAWDLGYFYFSIPGLADIPRGKQAPSSSLSTGLPCELARMRYTESSEYGWIYANEFDVSQSKDNRASKVPAFADDPGGLQCLFSSGGQQLGTQVVDESYADRFIELVNAYRELPAVITSSGHATVRGHCDLVYFPDRTTFATTDIQEGRCG